MDKLCDLMSRIVQYAPMEAAVDQVDTKISYITIYISLLDGTRLYS